MYSVILYDFIALAVSASVLVSSYRALKSYKKRIGYLTELEDYCLELRHRYGESKILADAVFASFDPAEKKIGKYAYGMMRVFSNDRSEDMNATAYGESLTEPYEKLLVAVCGLVEEYGDNTGCSFSETILKIVTDIREERRHLIKRSHGFKGLAATAAVPCLFVRPLGNWGMDSIPSLIDFYHGRGGVYLRCVVLALTFMCGMAVRILSNPVSFRDRLRSLGRKMGTLRIPEKTMGSLKSYLCGKLDRLDIRIGAGRIFFGSFLVAGIFFLISFMSILLGHSDRRNDYIHDTSDIENTLKVADTATINAAKRVIPYLMENTTEGIGVYTEQELIDEISAAGVRSREDAGHVAEEYYERLKRFAGEETDFFDLLFVLTMSALGWALPTVALAALGVALDNRIKEEVMQFESVIDMEKDMNGMTVPIMLDSMMSFASVTRSALIKTITDYNTNEEKAFAHLGEAGNDRTLKRLAGFFAMTDMLGIRHAFDEVSAELDGMREERSLERTLRLEDEVMLAGILSVLPGGLVVFGYLLVPFITRSLEMFNAYSDSLGMM